MTLPEFKQVVSLLLNDERYKAQRAVDELTNLPANTLQEHNELLKKYNDRLENMQNALRFLENLK